MVAEPQSLLLLLAEGWGVPWCGRILLCGHQSAMGTGWGRWGDCPNDGHIPHGTSTIEPRTGGTRTTPRHRLVPIFPSCREAAEPGRQKLPPGTAQHPLFPAAKPLFGGRFAFSPLLKPFLTRRGGQPRWGAQPGGSPPPPGGMLEARRGENRRAASRTQTDGGLGRKGGGGQPESTEEGSTKWGERSGRLASPGQSGASPAAAPPSSPQARAGTHPRRRGARGAPPP